jgi:hypothetical protein
MRLLSISKVPAAHLRPPLLSMSTEGLFPAARPARPSRTLNYASGSHHAALLVSDQNKGLGLQTRGPGIGVMPDPKYPSARIQVPSPAEIYLFSDGVYEIARPDGSWQSWEEFSQFLQENEPPIEMIVERMRAMHGVEEFEDDFSLLKIKLAQASPVTSPPVQGRRRRPAEWGQVVPHHRFLSSPAHRAPTTL